ncbi:MAG TPA: metallophosphoesterase [Planctomycetota bacterium]|nr:metallophosphoesterase [Planctomycetota bacterium]
MRLAVSWSAWLVLVCVTGCARSPWSPPLAGVDPPAQLAIDPYLLDVGVGEATICWRTATGRASRLCYRSAAAVSTTIVHTPTGVQHTVHLADLSPGTVHHYDVEGHRGSFRTLQPKSAVFLAIGHTHGTEQFDHYLDTLLASALVEQNADFVVHTGDSTWRALVGDYERFLFRPFHCVLANTPVFIAPGNHDSGWPFPDGIDLRAFRTVFPHEYPAPIAGDRNNAYYGCTKAGIRFTFLSYVADQDPDAPQMRFLRQELALPARLHAVVFGGSQTGYYDEPALLRVLHEGGCALVLRGDGQQPEQVRVWDAELPMYFVGTGDGEAHALLRFEWSDPTLRVERLLPTGARQLVDELAVASGRLVPRAGAARVERAALPLASPPSDLAPDADPTAVAVLRLPAGARGKNELAVLGRELGVDGVVAQIGTHSVFGAAVGAIEEGAGWRAGRVGRIGVCCIDDPSRAGHGPRPSAAASRQLDGFRVAVVRGPLPAAADLAHTLGDEFDLVLSEGPETAPGRLGSARWIRCPARLPQQLVLEAHATHLTVKLVSAARACHLLGWAFLPVRGAERHAIDPAQLEWVPHRDVVTTRLPMDGVRPRGLGFRVHLALGLDRIVLSADCRPRDLQPGADGHTPRFEGFRSDYFTVGADDGEVFLPLTTSADGVSVHEVGEVLFSLQSPATEADVQFLDLFWY